jgi:hypothetical protein
MSKDKKEVDSRCLEEQQKKAKLWNDMMGKKKESMSETTRLTEEEELLKQRYREWLSNDANWDEPILDGSLLATVKQEMAQGQQEHTFFPREGESPVDDYYKLKADKGKPRVSLVPSEAILATAEIMEYGIEKYGEEDSWTKVEVRRYIDAAYRHLLAFKDDYFHKDEESGKESFKHFLCDAVFVASILISSQNRFKHENS